jgi:hypothetical protein
MKIRIVSHLKHETAEWILVDELIETERGAGGFERTGVK